MRRWSWGPARTQSLWIMQIWHVLSLVLLLPGLLSATSRQMPVKEARKTHRHQNVLTKWQLGESDMLELEGL